MAAARPAAAHETVIPHHLSAGTVWILVGTAACLAAAVLVLALRAARRPDR